MAFNKNTADFPKSKNEEERQANIQRASKVDDEFKNPCVKEMQKCYQCLIDNNYNRSACQLVHHNYKRCRGFWNKVTLDRRKNGIKPEMPWPEEREKIKQQYFESFNSKD